ncbi:DUF1802 family protein [Gloeocapsopsis sp. IPPAS B-1203]|uniref:DUF1802 family protein n=1 Tax=Gloeocapsopsis sp. IPPAS B-1203 TaxID=2049454 RepID=UPI000C194E83|nr:DUF1802 family protein [Gloeocapsopsis sp. IPPAS B-1203]PIG92013.1 hypothetical protein CSQ79_17540 [Gloeocapsopsis sp. IPPAS B-1203]
MQLNTSHALKEWAVAVEALEQAKTIVLLRKGGIHEQGGHFRVAYGRVLLYPTYEHQQPALLKPEYAQAVTPVPSGWHPETVRIGSWAEITDIVPVNQPSAVEALLPFHIWNEKFISDRLKWKSRQPLYILLLRTYILPQVHIPYSAEYGGCKSWIDIVQTIFLENSQAVLSDETYSHKVAEIRQTVNHVLQEASC